jgi:hypothetical protein
MAQAVSSRPLTAEAHVCAQVSLCEICVAQSGTGTSFLRLLLFSLTISFRHGSPCSYSTRGMNNRPVTGLASETLPHPIDMNKDIISKLWAHSNPEYNASK